MDTEKQIPYKFEAHFESQPVPTSDPDLCKCKVRVFYSGENRNGSYITPEFAQKLAVTAYNKPVFGYYDHMKKDFGGHEGPEKVKAYGFVIPDSLTWEEHLDDDANVRTYATYEVLVWAEYWDEAKQIFNLGQSMELDPSTVKGQWKAVGEFDNECFVFTEGTVIGLCILGTEKVPCFEGAAFFSCEDSDYKKFVEAIKKYTKNGGSTTMEEEKVVFDEEIAESAAESEPSEQPAAEPAVEPAVEETVVEAAAEPEAAEEVVESADEPTIEVVSEPVEEPAEDLIIEPAPVVEAPDEEAHEAFMKDLEELKQQYATLLETLNDLQEKFSGVEKSLQEKENAYNLVVEELNSTKSAFEAERATNAVMSAKLKEYEDAEKAQLLETFANTIPSEILQSYSDKAAELTVDELNTKLSIEYTKYSLAKEKQIEVRVPVPQQESGLAQILNKYRK